MACRWTNKNCIKRDLYVAQGRKVPADIDGTTAVDKPPRPKFTEESHDYLQNYTVFDDFQPPNFNLIQEMLNVVRGTDIDPGDEISILQSPLDPVNNEFFPKCVSTPLPEETLQLDIRKKQKRQRNVAIASLLEAIDGHDNFVNGNYKKQNLAVSSKTITLLKPTDFVIQKGPELIQNSEDLVNMDKSNNLMEKRAKKILLEPKLLFKKKVSSGKSNDNVVGSRQLESNNSNISMYVPSALVDIYYQKFKARGFVKQFIQEYLWVKVEEQIREIDEKKELAEKLNKALDIAENKMIETSDGNDNTVIESSIENNNSEMSMDNSKSEKLSQDSESKESAATEEMSNSVILTEDLSVLQDPAKYGMKIVELPRHRHLLTGECVVCKVIGKIESTIAK